MVRLLVVDDSQSQLMAIRALLADEPFDLVTAEDGKVALDMIAQQAPDIVVTDILMPNIDGLGLVKHLRQIKPQIPVILISEVGSEEVSVEALRIGATAFVPKSRIHEELAGTIRRTLELVQTDYSYSSLIDRLDYHEFQFCLDNDPSAIGPVVNLMQQMAAGFQPMDDVTRSRIGSAVEQALHNAIFRGNLELSRQEYQADQEIEAEGKTSLVDLRRKEAPYSSRKVLFRARIAKQSVEFTVRDGGKGFDASQYTPSQHLEKLSMDGGRGLVLIHTFMDSVQFNDRGNEITMVKQLNPLVE